MKEYLIYLKEIILTDSVYINMLLPSIKVYITLHIILRNMNSVQRVI